MAAPGPWSRNPRPEVQFQRFLHLDDAFKAEWRAHHKPPPAAWACISHGPRPLGGGRAGLDCAWAMQSSSLCRNVKCPVMGVQTVKNRGCDRHALSP